MTDPLRHLVCEIRENDTPPFRTNCFKAWGPCISAMKFSGFPNMSTSCLTATVSLRNWYTYWQMASFQSLDATVHKNITSTHSSTQFLLSQINPICTMNFFLGILYVCNGGWILTVVRALINFRHLTNRHESYTKSKKNIYLDKSQKEIHIAMLHINWYVTETCPRMWGEEFQVGWITYMHFSHKAHTACCAGDIGNLTSVSQNVGYFHQYNTKIVS